MNKDNILWKMKVIRIICMLCICVLLVVCNKKSYDNSLTSEEKEETSDSTADMLKEMELNGVKVYPAIIRIDNYNTDYNIEYPNIDVKSSEMQEIFNEQIYNAVFPESLSQYNECTRWTDITYEITFFDEQFLEIHFTGETAYSGSYMEFDRGMLFNLETGEIMSLSDFYSLSEIKKIIYDAWEKEEISVLKLHLVEEDIKGIIADFVDLFDTDEFICQTDNFYISENHIYFLAPPPESMRQKVYIEMDIEKFPAIIGD